MQHILLKSLDGGAYFNLNSFLIKMIFNISHIMCPTDVFNTLVQIISTQRKYLRVYIGKVCIIIVSEFTLRILCMVKLYQLENVRFFSSFSQSCLEC